MASVWFGRRGIVKDVYFFLLYFLHMVLFEGLGLYYQGVQVAYGYGVFSSLRFLFYRSTCIEGFFFTPEPPFFVSLITEAAIASVAL